MPNPKDPPAEVAKIKVALKEFMDTTNPDGVKIGSSTCSVYAFFDFDGEPIYVGQTVESLRGRISRHLTGRRSDAVGKFVLDPFEVLEIEVWPMFGIAKSERKALGDRMEFAVFQNLLLASTFGAILNEGAIPPADPIDLPPSYRGRIIPDDMMEDRSHPDVRLARRAATIASLARLISERQVNKPLRVTLSVQAQRLEALAAARLADFEDEPDGVASDD